MPAPVAQPCAGSTAAAPAQEAGAEDLTAAKEQLQSVPALMGQPCVDGAGAAPARTDGAENMAAVVDKHLQIVQALAEQRCADGVDQRARRAVEQQVRGRALALAERLAEQGLSLDEAGARLGLSARTLRHWALQRQRAAALVLRGRQVADSGPEAQQAVLQHLQEVGPGLGVAALRLQFPELARAELDGLVQSYRDLWREKERRLLHVLHWQRPGTVWALDFAEAPSWIDGVYPYLLAVRDLASGQQLLWRPVWALTAEVVGAELLPLFLAYGAPWVLKSDNGSAFRDEGTKRLLQRWSVFTLFSPPRTPSYNGSIEAAIGAAKRRSQRLAEEAGHAGEWTSAVVEAARQEANATARPRRLRGATAEEVWESRWVLQAAEREEFRSSVHREQEAEWLAQGGLPAGTVSHWEQAAVDRVALRRALVAHGLLLFRRRSIPAQITRPKTATKG